MTDTAVSAAGLTKRYRTGPDTWIDAVHDVSFEIKAGEAVGLIGRNGAGKSTLLKLLSRVSRPTAGYADIYGRVGALLEVGTGFHPELSGRENAYLSGAILGLSRADVRARFDEMVAFAEIEPFIDMPVKRYSSGMFARLGFAVAAHLRPEILIVDEVLAVGDLPFQAKCLSLMHRLTETGTTVLFVSHNLLAVSDLCNRALVLEDGAVRFDGPAGEAIAEYRRLLASLKRERDLPLEGLLRPRINGRPAADAVVVMPGNPIRVDVPIERAGNAAEVDVLMNLVIEAADGRTVIHLRSDVSGARVTLRPGSNILTTHLQELPLAPGAYSLWLRVVGLDEQEPIMWDTERTTLEVQGDQAMGSLVVPRHSFEHSVAADAPDLASVGRP